MLVLGAEWGQLLFKVSGWFGLSLGFGRDDDLGCETVTLTTGLEGHPLPPLVTEPPGHLLPL